MALMTVFTKPSVTRWRCRSRLTIWCRSACSMPTRCRVRTRITACYCGRRWIRWRSCPSVCLSTNGAGVYLTAQSCLRITTPPGRVYVSSIRVSCHRSNVLQIHSMPVPNITSQATHPIPVISLRAYCSSSSTKLHATPQAGKARFIAARFMATKKWATG